MCRACVPPVSPRPCATCRQAWPVRALLARPQVSRCRMPALPGRNKPPPCLVMPAVFVGSRSIPGTRICRRGCFRSPPRRQLPAIAMICGWRDNRRVRFLSGDPHACIRCSINVSSRLAAIPSILRQASGRRPRRARRPGIRPTPPRICLMPDWPNAAPGCDVPAGLALAHAMAPSRGLSRVMGGSIWRLLAAAGMALAAATASAVDVNNATAQQLESVSGIGPSTARTIVRSARTRRRLRIAGRSGRGACAASAKKAKALQAAGLTVGGADGAAQNAAQGAATPAGRAARRLARPSPPRVGPPRRPAVSHAVLHVPRREGRRACPGAGAALRPTRAPGL